MRYILLYPQNGDHVVTIDFTLCFVFFLPRRDFFLLIVLFFSSSLFVLMVRMSPLFIKGYLT